MDTKTKINNDKGITKFLYSSLVDFSEIITDDKKKQQKIQTIVAGTIGAIAGIMYFKNLRETNEKTEK
jgi:purine-cytosine permease-like protein